jgi:hypothetical protein
MPTEHTEHTEEPFGYSVYSVGHSLVFISVH